MQIPRRPRTAQLARLGVVIRHDGRARESWVRYHMRLGPLTPLGRLVFYAIAVVVLLGVAWVLVGSTLAGLLMLALAAGP